MESKRKDPKREGELHETLCQNHYRSYTVYCVPRDKEKLYCFSMYCAFRVLYAIEEVILAQCEDKILILEQN